MHQHENIHSDTPLDAKELRELIARLTDPAQKNNDHRTRVKDVAESMDMDVDQVASALQQMRSEKASSEAPPKEVEKLAAVLDGMKTPIRRRTRLSSTHRMIFLSSFLIFLLMTGGFVAVHRLVGSQSSLSKITTGPTFNKRTYIQAPRTRLPERP